MLLLPTCRSQCIVQVFRGRVDYVNAKCKNFAGYGIDHEPSKNFTSENFMSERYVHQLKLTKESAGPKPQVQVIMTT